MRKQGLLDPLLVTAMVKDRTPSLSLSLSDNLFHPYSLLPLSYTHARTRTRTHTLIPLSHLCAHNSPMTQGGKMTPLLPTNLLYFYLRKLSNVKTVLHRMLRVIFRSYNTYLCIDPPFPVA